MTFRLRSGRLAAGVVASAAAIGTAAISYQHLFHVSLLDAEAFPEQVSACGRHFAINEKSAITTLRTATTSEPGRESIQQVGEFNAPLHRSMELFGRPHELACGVGIYVGPDDEHLRSYSLLGGP